MRSLFVDTSFYVATVSPKDALHMIARERVRLHAGGLVTTEQVLMETGNWLAASGDRAVFSDLLQSIQADPKTVVVWASRPLFEAGASLYAERPDKDWSLTDCISFVVMRDRGLAAALTGDHHFEQAGFKALLR